MFLMNYTYTIGEDFPDYAKKSTWDHFHEYIDVDSQSLIDEYPGYLL